MKILIIHMGALGDVILSLPAMQLIRDSYSQARLYLLGNKNILDFIAKDLGAQEVYSVDQSGFSSLFIEDGFVSPALKDFFQGVEIVFLFTRKPDSIFVHNLKSCFSDKVRVIPCLPSKSNTHVTHFQFEYLKDLGTSKAYLPTRFRKNEKIDSVPSPRFFKDLGVERPHFETLIGIHPGSGSIKKCWPMESFQDLMQELAVSYQAGFIFFLGPAEEERAESYLKKNIPGVKVLTAIRRSLEEVARFLRHCKVYVGNDSGITHLAAALGIPTIAIFGPTDPGLWRPLGERVVTVLPSKECAPCEGRVYLECLDRSCLKSIKVQDVNDAVSKLAG